MLTVLMLAPRCELPVDASGEPNLVSQAFAVEESDET
jgi:hypothetical protein